ncbi:MAG TPA: hypothetical protein VFV43_10720 [Limnobacter sp.]|nr:hypothetical protein [Limnobacter sp.]
MKTSRTLTFKWATTPAIALLAAGCVVVAPVPGESGPSSGNQGGGNPATATMCNIEGKQKQDLSDGTTKATVTQSCQETVIFIENQHKEHPKRCRVAIAGQGTELYIMPGESRTLTQTGPVAQAQVAVGCVNDWNRTR